MQEAPFLPFVRLQELCNRARDHYLEVHRITDPGWRHNVRTSIPRSHRPDADGWVQISNLADRFQVQHFRILWHPETDRLRLFNPERHLGCDQTGIMPQSSISTRCK